MSFRGKVALVTGAGHGIGEATAKLLAENGASVVCNSKSASCVRVAAEINAARGRAIYFIADITDSNSVKAMIDKTIEAFGRLDILVNNAGWWGIPGSEIEDLKEKDWMQLIDINLTGHFHCTRFAVPYMKKQRYGKIVNIGSRAGLDWSRNGNCAYCAAKAGIGGLTRELAHKLAALNINVNCVAPGAIETYPEKAVKPENMNAEQKAEQQKILESIPARRKGTPIEVAKLIAFLASDDASYIQGQTIIIDGGVHMIS